MSGTKKRMSDDISFKRKKIKTVDTNSDLIDPDAKTDDTSGDVTAELLDAQTVREGMLLLGCVIEVKMTFLVMSLPGYLSGVVPLNNISNAFTKYLTDNSVEDRETSSIDSIVKVGMVFPCKVMKISKERKISITLSINPQDVNAELKPSSIYCKMLLFVSVCNVEDHGYIVDTGAKCIQGFLSKQHSCDQNRELTVGEVIPTFIQKISYVDQFSAKIQLSELDFSDDFPEIPIHNIKLSSVLPGSKIRADVIEVKYPFVFMKYLHFDVCASILSLGTTRKIKAGHVVLGSVLYVHPVTHVIYLKLSLRPSPHIYSGYFGLKKLECVKNLKFQCFYKNCAYYKIRNCTYGFISIKHLPKEGRKSFSNVPSPVNHISKARVLSLHYMDNIVQMTAKPSMVDQNIIFPEEVQIGDVFDAVVKKHVDEGMHVCICPGLFGFVRRIHISDFLVTKPELFHPTGSKVKCRVLSIDENGKLNLTSKESLVNLPEASVLSSYDNAQAGQVCKGVVVQKTDSYILVLFFNNIKGMVPFSHLYKGAIFYKGQTVLCKVIESNAAKKKLKLSLQTEELCSVEEFADLLDATYESNENIVTTNVENVKSSSKTSTAISSKTDSNKSEKRGGNALSSSESCKIMQVPDFDSHKPVEAVIMKVKGSQLNILLNESRGRVHITELGCTSEGIYPLRGFFSGKKINVHIIGEYCKKKRNHLEISHRNIVPFKECTLYLSPVSSSKDMNRGASVIGFVKEVYDVSAVLWLSATETGVLDYLHFSERPKVVKKLHQHLKVGLSLKVSVLDNQWHSEMEKGSQSIALTKIEVNLPQVGNNILGLVQIGCLDRGLILKLPFGYHGVASITDLTDVYSPVNTLLEKFRTLKFVLCHVLEVNHQIKYCQVSLRKSRVYKKKITLDNIFCPEILSNNISEGDIVKGFVKSVSNSVLIVVFGRNLEGKVYIHNCLIIDCGACSVSKCIIDKYPVGSVLEVVIEKISTDEKSFTLVISNSRSLENTRYNRLNIKEDISWDETD